MVNIVFLFTGESRNSPFANNPDITNYEILKSYNDFLFTDDFKHNHKYKIYMSTDDISLEKTFSYFGEENIGNIHLSNPSKTTGEYYMKEPKNKINDITTYLESYNNKDWSQHQRYPNSIQQHHRILDCYNLFKHNIDIEKPDYIIRIRFDCKITNNINNLLCQIIENPDIKIIIHWDFFAIGEPDIMNCYCTGLENNYGNYKYETPVPEILPVMNDHTDPNGNYHNRNRRVWTYSPERQLFEMLFEYCNNNGLDINKTIKNVECSPMRISISRYSSQCFFNCCNKYDLNIFETIQNYNVDFCLFEKQLENAIVEYCKNNGLDIKDVIITQEIIDKFELHFYTNNFIWLYYENHI